ncbi:S41 family peptidase [Parapedobacter deserti]|uniref:Tricorn protease homolog n=1 Tax=Parapedobacter deserti TaxID=1912957 RepID=A0ABV7JPX6_9SPHI
MKSPLFILALLVFSLTAFAQGDVRFMTYPALSPDGSTVVFSQGGDLWKADAGGGLATRLTAMDGSEIKPRISPDGKWLAFSANQSGNYNVYLMPLQGGEVVQLTHHEGHDEVDGWSWDSSTIYFTSTRYNRYSAYKVTIKGGTAERLFGHYFNFIHDVAEAPSGELYFSDTWESKDQAHRKGYKGPFNPDIQSYHPVSGQYTQYTDYPGKDMWPTIDRQGNVYFVSDESNGEYNLYTLKDGKKTRLTNFKTSIKRPFVSASGERVVFEHDYQLYLFDAAAKRTTPLNISIPRHHLLEQLREFDVKDAISNFDVSPDGKKMAFISRGELFISDPEGKFIRKVERGNVERAMEVKWLADNRTLLFTQTSEGFLNLFTIPADGSGPAKQLTSEQRNNRALAFNPKRTAAVYLSGRDEVRLLDLKTFKSNVLVTDEIWAVQNAEPSFSPNGEYVLFTAFRNFEQDIFVHHIARKQTLNLTNTGVTETNPIWSPDGKYIYFTSSPTRPAYPYGLQQPGVYRMALDFYEGPFRSDKVDSLFATKPDREEAKKRADADKKPKLDSSKTGADSLRPIAINTLRLMDRLERVGPPSGSQMISSIFQRGQKTYVFLTSTHENLRGATYRVVYEPFEREKTEKVMDGRLSSIINVGSKYYGLSGGKVHSYNVDANKVTPISKTYKYTRNLQGEFVQMFEETWAGMDENFYDERFHGKDWKAIRTRYAAYVPYINNRGDLRILLNDMLGELNSSHVGFSSSGPEERNPVNMITNETGIIFDDQAPYRVARSVYNTPAALAEKDIRPGDELVSVNGVAVDRTVDRDVFFTFPSLLDELVLVFDRQGQQRTVKLHPIRSATLKDRLYDEWIAENRRKVDEGSSDRIAYSHMKNMSSGELQVFLKDMIAQEHKEGIILDLRYNTGGNVHDEVLKFLSQRPYLHWQYRGGKRSPQGHFAPAAKPIVLLVNEQSLSDAEMTAAGFKALGLGTVIGNETYRWIIFTSGKGLVDGSSYRLPSWGCYTLGGDNIEQEGVKPDMLIKNTFVDRITGKDPQLESAIQHINGQIGK